MMCEVHIDISTEMGIQIISNFFKEMDQDFI